MAISKRHRKEIIDLATPGVPPDTPREHWDDDAILDKLVRAADRKRKAWLKAATDPHELHLFAENWQWDEAGGAPMLLLVENAHCDAGTMLFKPAGDVLGYNASTLPSLSSHLHYRLFSPCPSQACYARWLFAHRWRQDTSPLMCRRSNAVEPSLSPFGSSSVWACAPAHCLPRTGPRRRRIDRELS